MLAKNEGSFAIQKAPGRSHREGLTVIELLRVFPGDATAEKWFEVHRWVNGRFCPHCGPTDTREEANRKPMPYRCRDCRKHFSIMHGTAMQSSKIGLQRWAIAIYPMATGINGTSSMKLYRELGIRQATAWFMMHRIREAFDAGDGLPLHGPIEADETYIGGKRKNMSNAERHKMKDERRDPVGKEAIVNVRGHATKQVRAKVIWAADEAHVAGFVVSQTEEGAKVYTDEAKVYNALKSRFDYESVNHSVSESVRNQAHTNGIESFWAAFKRFRHRILHHVSPQHLHRCVNEFSSRHKIRDLDALAQMTVIVQDIVGKRLKYFDLVGKIGAGP